MSINLNGGTVEVFKFKSTGIVALCREVVEFVQSERFERYNLDADTAHFEETDSLLKVVFHTKQATPEELSAMVLRGEITYNEAIDLVQERLLQERGRR